MSDGKDPYGHLFVNSNKDEYHLTKAIMIVYYVVFNATLMMITFDSYYEFMRKKDWFVISISLLLLNNFCQFLRYI